MVPFPLGLSSVGHSLHTWMPIPVDLWSCLASRRLFSARLPSWQHPCGLRCGIFSTTHGFCLWAPQFGSDSARCDAPGLYTSTHPPGCVAGSILLRDVSPQAGSLPFPSALGYGLLSPTPSVAPTLALLPASSSTGFRHQGQHPTPLSKPGPARWVPSPAAI